MQTIKAKAIVGENSQLSLLDAPLDIEKDSIVEVIIFYQKKKHGKKERQKILERTGTYSKEELLGFTEVRRAFDQWKPTEL